MERMRQKFPVNQSDSFARGNKPLPPGSNPPNVAAQDISGPKDGTRAGSKLLTGFSSSPAARSQFKNPLIQTYKNVAKSKKQIAEQETRQMAQSTVPQRAFVSTSSSSLALFPVSIKSNSQQSTSSFMDIGLDEEDSSEPLPNVPTEFPLDVGKANELDVQSKRKAEPFPLDTLFEHSSRCLPKPFPMDLGEIPSPSSEDTIEIKDILDVLCTPPRTRPLSTSPSTRSLSELGELCVTVKSQGGANAVKPFPLSTPELEEQTFETNGGLSVPPDNPSLNKSRTAHGSHLAPGLEVDISYDTSDAIDPSTICPFCDEPWPSDPSAELTNLLARARRKAWPHKRYTNPEGLKAPLEAIIDLCNTHRSEASIIPEGIAKGWPSEIDFDAIPNRLWKLKPALQKLIDFPSGWHFFDIAKKDIQQFGAAATNSTRGQFSTFSRTQPGYYGERGLVRIANGLHDLFPGLSTRPSFAPLDVENFLLRVLIPETARLLIMEDLDLDEADALSVLRESQKYGVAKFPDRGEEDALEKFGVSMRVRLKLGQERHLADTKEAERELRTERRKTKKNKHDLPPNPTPPL
ncbi:RTC4-like domain-containing protein [Cantharellus anzutake]|uniref:RTC4-like domain-containing protein n=1 Tax=Cantharellus anzutake TaxID=1750568 RepID=UPI001903623B|nr:RTC4-like domain-containing protein [Cantharellus anzutake]KAF8324247.1 RTC4-like domain-containing protein [Cantharellus anzutake]